MTRARITGVGAYAPKRILTNADLEKMIETSDAWIVKRSGIRERHIADENEATSDLALRAAQQALERANLVPEDVDFIAVGTTTPDMFFPTVPNILHHPPPAPARLPPGRLGGRARRLRGLRLQPLHRLAVHPDREVPPRAVHRRRDPVADHR